MVNSQTYCLPCTGNCKTCNSSAPTMCFSCWPDSFINITDNTCVNCNFPCSSCINNNADTCSSCAQGYVFISTNNSCINQSNVTNAIDNCANQVATSTTAATVTCTLCLQGYAQTPAGCVPCPEGCQVCNAADLVACQ